MPELLPSVPLSPFDGLPPPWSHCFQIAWEAFKSGSIGVGAVIVDGEGVLLLQGRNRIGESTGPPNQLANTYLAHAEVNALAGLPPGDYPQHTLYTTLEPCLLCRAAAMHAHIGHVYYAGRDLLWEGLHLLPQLNAHVQRRWPLWRGPLHGPLGMWGTLLPLMHSLRVAPDGFVVQCHREVMPDLVDLGLSLLDSGELDHLVTGPLEDALTAVWTRLERCEQSLRPPSSGMTDITSRWRSE